MQYMSTDKKRVGEGKATAKSKYVRQVLKSQLNRKNRINAFQSTGIQLAQYVGQEKKRQLLISRTEKLSGNISPTSQHLETGEIYRITEHVDKHVDKGIRRGYEKKR